jgi:hypothetical protein
MLGLREEGDSVATDLPRSEPERHAGRADHDSSLPLPHTSRWQRWRGPRARAISEYGVRPAGIHLSRYRLPLSRRPRARQAFDASGQMIGLVGPETPDHGPHHSIPRNRTADTIAEWKAVADGLLTNQCCAFHRNIEISSRYAWVYKLQPTCFKWAAMAAFASHHVRLALFPLRLDTDGTGYVDIPHSVGRRRLLLMEDVNTIRATNNAIFDDIFWVHLAYVTADDGFDRLRGLLRSERHYAPVLAGLEAIDHGRRILDDPTTSAEARQAADELIWEGNVQILEHEQRALVQPNFDRLSCAFARLVSIGSTTSFEVRGVRQEVAYFTSFYLYSLTRGIPHALRAHTWPRITRYDDRWRWLLTDVVPRFRRLDAETHLIDASLRRIFHEARAYASTPCVLPLSPADGEPETND